MVRNDGLTESAGKAEKGQKKSWPQIEKILALARKNNKEAAKNHPVSHKDKRRPAPLVINRESAVDATRQGVPTTPSKIPVPAGKKPPLLPKSPGASKPPCPPPRFSKSVAKPTSPGCQTSYPTPKPRERRHASELVTTPRAPINSLPQRDSRVSVKPPLPPTKPRPQPPSVHPRRSTAKPPLADPAFTTRKKEVSSPLSDTNQPVPSPRQPLYTRSKTCLDLSSRSASRYLPSGEEQPKNISGERVLGSSWLLESMEGKPEGTKKERLSVGSFDASLTRSHQLTAEEHANLFSLPELRQFQSSPSNGGNDPLKRQAFIALSTSLTTTSSPKTRDENSSMLSLPEPIQPLPSHINSDTSLASKKCNTPTTRVTRKPRVEIKRRGEHSKRERVLDSSWLSDSMAVDGTYLHTERTLEWLFTAFLCVF